MDKVLWVILITSIAGIGGTGMGGIIGVIMKRDSTKVVSLLLAFAGGVMLSVVNFDLIPTAFHPEGAVKDMPLFLIIAGVVLGYGLIYLLNYVIDKKVNPEIAHIDENHPATADQLDELIHADHLKKHSEEGNKYEMFIAGVVMACAIGLHNIPEGMVIGASYAEAAGNMFGNAGFLVALIIGLHNIPEGMSVSVPLVTGGLHAAKAIAITFLSGASTVLGAVIGLLIGLISPVWLSLSLSFAGGAMLYVVFGELLPEAFLMWKSKAPGAMTLLGLLIGLILVTV